MIGATEDAILRRYLSENNEDLCRNVFEDYCSKLKKRLRAFPLYPAASIKQMARLLPSAQELDHDEALKDEMEPSAQ